MTKTVPTGEELLQALNQLSEEDIAKIKTEIEKDEAKAQKHKIEVQKRMEQHTQEIISDIPTVYSEYITKQTDNYIEVDIPVVLDNSLGFTTVYEQAGQEIYNTIYLDIGNLPNCWTVTPSLVAIGVNKNSLDDKLVYKITLINKNNNYKVLFEFNLVDSFSEMLANINKLKED